MSKSINIKLTEPTPFLKDFHTFLNYSEQKKPRLTASKEYINRSDLWKINQLLEMPATDVNKRNDQEYYLPIQFYFHLAKEARFFQIDRSKKKAFKMLIDKERTAMFKALTPTGQYLFLLKTYWVYCDWEDMTNPNNRGVSGYAVTRFMEVMKDAEINKAYDQSSQLRRSLGFSMLHEHLLYWQFLGWVSHVERNSKKDYGKSFYSYKSFQVTDFGKKIAGILAKERSFKNWNIPYETNQSYDPGMMLDDIMGTEIEEEEVLQMPENPTPEQIQAFFSSLEKMTKEQFGVNLDFKAILKKFTEQKDKSSLEEFNEFIMEAIENAPKEAFELAFADYFPDGKIPTLEVQTPLVIQKGKYVLKVALKYQPDIWRVIEMNHDHTMEDLHLAIQRFYQFDDDHMYCFYMDNKRHSKKRINVPSSYSEPPFADDITLGETLYINQQFLYYFDFGDSWEFHVDVLDIVESAEKLDSINLIKTNGKAPPQYHWEDEEEDW